MDELKQRKLLTVYEFKIVENGVRTKKKSLTDGYENVTPFEIMTNRVSWYKKNNKAWFIPCGFFLFVGICVMSTTLEGKYRGDNTDFIMPFVLAALFLFLFFVRGKNFRYIELNDKKGQTFSVYGNIPNEKAVEGFIENVLQKRNNYLKEKYAKVEDKEPIEEQLNKFRWLLNEGIITKSEFETFKNKLLGKDDDSPTPIGFRNT